MPLNLFFRPLSIYSGFFLTLLLTACQTAAPEIVRPAPLPQDPLIQVYTNHDPAFSYTEPYRNQTRDGNNLEQIMIDAISRAQATVDVAVQEFRLPGIAQALAKRQDAGVRVRVILENTYSRPYSSFSAAEIAQLPDRERDRYQEAVRLIDLNDDGNLSQEEIDQRDALIILDKARVQRIDDTADGSAGSNLMHNKFVVVDGQTIIMTSANFTTSDVHGDFKSRHSRGNANNLLKITSSELASVFTQEFNQMWGDGPGGKPNSRFGVKKQSQYARQVNIGETLVEVQFSPNRRSVPWEKTTNGLIGKTLKDAKQSIQLALFVFSEQKLSNLLEAVHQQGTTIQALIDPGFAYRSYSEALDMMGVSLSEDCKPDPDNRVWTEPVSTIGVPRLPPGDLLHHKFGIVDSRTVITGSHNWTAAANIGNDETVLVIHNQTVVAHYIREFERLYANAILGVPPALKKKIAAQQNQCQGSQAIASPKSSSPQPSFAAKLQPTVAKDHSSKSIKSHPSLKAISSAQQLTGQPKGSQRVNLNTATQAELETLPGVGPALATRIIAARQTKRFASLTDLDKIPGVGPKLLQTLQDKVNW